MKNWILDDLSRLMRLFECQAHVGAGLTNTTSPWIRIGTLRCSQGAPLTERLFVHDYALALLASSLASDTARWCKTVPKSG